MLDTTVTNINWTTKNLTYQTLGKQLKSEAYDYLVLATGLRPRTLPASMPGSDLRNIFYLRTMEDVNNLVSKFSLTTKTNNSLFSYCLIISFCFIKKIKSNHQKRKILLLSVIHLLRRNYVDG